MRRKEEVNEAQGQGLTGWKQLRCIASQAGQEDRGVTAREILVHLLRQGDRQAPFGWHLELQVLQQGMSIGAVGSKVTRAQVGLTNTTRPWPVERTSCPHPQPPRQDRQCDVCASWRRRKREAM